MSDAQHDHDAPHEGPIKTPRQLILAVFFSFVIPIAVIVLLVMYVGAEKKPAAGSEAFTAQAVEQRVKPIGMVEVKDLSDASAMKTGEQVFNSVCIACHGTGAAGAPKFGDAAAWGPRIGQGYEALLNAALHGKGAMGAQGGGDYSDFEIGRAVVYMANKGGANFPEPKFVAPGSEAAASAPEAQPVAAAAPASQAAAAATEAPAAPVAAAATAEAPAAGGAVPALYTSTCQVCHGAGIAGAPKFGDKAAWAPRIAEAKDIDGMTAIAIKGKGAMPPKGGSTASDAEIKEVVAYMLNAVK